MTANEFLRLLPTINASLNGIAAILLGIGFWAIRTKKEQLHQQIMTSAFMVSTLFLLFYVVYHYQVGSVPFKKEGFLRILYFLVLIPHIILAATLVPLVITTVVYAKKGLRKKHRKLARWTLPIWFYVSITGVLIYYMLYHL
ncbi:MAG: putative membrane protein [bacterium]|jgi:putative membrane protein